MLYRVLVTDLRLPSSALPVWLAGHDLELGEALALAAHIVENVVLLIEGELRSESAATGPEDVLRVFGWRGEIPSILGEDGHIVPFNAHGKAAAYLASLSGMPLITDRLTERLVH